MIINIIGCDGSGKTTQLELLRSSIMEEYNLPVRVLTKAEALNTDRFPENRFFGMPYEDIASDLVPLMKGESRSLFLFYLLAASICRYPPQNDEIILSDGYWYKNLATEAAMGIPIQWLLGIGVFFPLPDVTIFLDVAPEKIVNRVLNFKSYECGGNEDCTVEKFIENQTKISMILKTIAGSHNWITIDGELPVKEIADMIKRLTKEKITTHFSNSGRQEVPV